MVEKKRSPKAEATRHRLIDAAAKEIAAVGYFNTDTNKIAAGAGYAPATFYKYFKNKLEIFLTAYDAWVTAEWQALTIEPGNPEALVRVVLAHHKKSVQFRTDLRALAATEPAVRRYQNKLRREQVKRLGELDPAFIPKSEDWSAQVFLFLTMERVSDAIADGSAKASNATETGLIHHLVDLIERLKANSG
ncbi:MAG: TetR/AcrR family transcriptional regulator [Rhodobiaceae bacterium]|nr:TetR/AcrR family transcriptional regulator [Rhodobiaceae bacterium]